MPSAFEHGPSLTVVASPTANAGVIWSAANNLGQSTVLLGTGTLGISGDTDIITLTANTVTVAGTVAATAYTGDGSSLTGISGTTINTNADNRVITGSGTANTLNGETGLTFSAGQLTVDSGATNVSAIVSIEVSASATSDPLLRWREGSGNGDANNQQYEAWMDVENGQFRFRSQNINGSSQEGDIWTVNDGTDDVNFNGEVKVKENNTLTSVNKGIAKAWIKNVADVSGGSSSGQDSYNITVSENGTGDRVYTFGDDFENAHYVAVGSAYGPAGSNLQAPIFGQNTLAVGSIDCLMRSSGGGNVDVPNSAAFFGEAT